MRHLLMALPAFLLLAAGQSYADNANVSTNPPAYQNGSNNQSMTPSGGVRVQPQDGAGNDVSAAHPAPTADQNGAAFGSAITMTPGASAVAVGRSVEILCTVAGNVSLQLGGSAHIISISASPYTQTFPYAVTGINTSGTTATATYSNLY